MQAVIYQHEFLYVFPEENNATSFPGLLIEVRNPVNEGNGIEVQAHLDTGAEYSLFTGEIAAAIGLNLLEGDPVTFSSTAGTEVDARRHGIVLAHEILGNFPMNLAFSTGDIRRNLLGRDFMRLIQIGFREYHTEFYVTPTP